jgi:hypothetical protein
MPGAIQVERVPVAGVTPATIRRYDSRARDLRAAAQAAALRRLFLAPWLCLERLVASAARR